MYQMPQQLIKEAVEDTTASRCLHWVHCSGCTGGGQQEATDANDGNPLKVG